MIRHNYQIKEADLTAFLAQLALLISAGLPLTNCLVLLTQGQTKTGMTKLLAHLHSSLLAGNTFCQSLMSSPNYFDEWTCGMILLGEQTGKLESVLHSIVEIKNKRLALKQFTLQALYYPAIIVMLTFLSLILMFIFVLPKFADIFAEMQAPLPPPTAVLFSVANWIQKNGFMLFILIFFSCCSYSLSDLNLFRFLKYKIIKLRWCQNLINKLFLLHFARDLALTLQAGVSLARALELLMRGYTSHQKHILHTLHQKISEGLSFTNAMKTLPIFPPLLIQLLSVGESTGRLEPSLEKAANLYETEIQGMVRIFKQILEPLIILVLGVLIGGLVITLYLPIFNLGSVLT